jgi:uncharacterized membrane protein YphA (DoxX/SURF4 family)
MTMPRAVGIRRIAPAAVPIELRLGRFIFALGLAGFAAVCFFFRDGVNSLQPLPPSTPWHAVLGYVTGVLMVGAAICVAADLELAVAALALGAFFMLWVLALHLPTLAPRPLRMGPWVGMMETVAFAGVAWMLAALAAADGSIGEPLRTLALRAANIGRWCVGLAFLLFALAHFMYGPFTASLIPAWIPARLFFAYLVGCAHLAAGLAVMTGIQARLAGRMLAIMFGIFAIILHIPRALASEHSRGRGEWTSLMVAVAMCGASLIVALDAARREAQVRAQDAAR